jgi:DNA-binding NarL/FixJ family response regulator
VLQRVMRGMMTKEIAFELRVSEPSVKGTIQQLFTKTGTRSRVQLVRFAFDHYLGRAAGDYAGTVNHV